MAETVEPVRGTAGAIFFLCMLNLRSERLTTEERVLGPPAEDQNALN